ncbi:MAG: ABC transporter ATP-binding protein [Acidobacteriota bacterium]|nr:ABC transporter ATP-binding protein [Acidobacteriota bacterium]MDE3043565.1 ABC transporter ATP-binding protein [Acidobacteriota bacterium]MDE3106914.1 ABC transporter ATP-binding protein [Acidobacteriota bacterium]MDE3222571.1 ABC transporter ATP-binding protein [Acidobacteriota bacterium]
MTQLLEIENVTKTFGGVTAVSQCSMSIREGTVVGLIGPNGAGKSSVIDLVSGFERPNEGSIRFDGREIVGKRPDQISRLGLIRTFQTPREWRDLSVIDNVRVGRSDLERDSLWRAVTTSRKLRRLEEGETGELRDLMTHYRLDTVRNQRAVGLSGGQKRLLEFARIAAARPRLTILDEPMGGVNPVLGERIGEAIRELKRNGSTVVVVEHNLPFIERTCDEVVVMDLGTVIAQGPFAELRDNKRVVDAYLGNDDE